MFGSRTVYVPTYMRLTDMIAGIGLCIAKEAVHRGARGVVIADLKLSSEAEEWQASTDEDTVAFERCDVTDWKALQSLPATSVKHFSDTPDVWVPAAGVFEPVSIVVISFLKE
jgi:NAD(P)-dependent dehydrogenase (short-subunit alcohol dehydrogenase family)